MLNHAIDISKFKMHGVYEISSDEYHSSEGISRSALMHFIKTPYHYFNEFINNNSLRTIKDSESIKIGSLFHTYILEPEKLDERYTICEKRDRRTKDGKEYYDKLTLISKGKELINSDDFEKVKLMADTILKDDQIKELINGAKYEKSLYWTDKNTELLCKVRPDIWHNNFICDIKTTISADYRNFQRSLYIYGYHIQCAMIYEAFKNIFNIEMTNFIFIVVENTWPHAFAIYQLDELALEQSVSIFKNKLLELKQCFDKKEWPSYKTQLITLPNYILGE
jgi:hypothetical protein